MRPVDPVPGQLVVGAGVVAFAFLFSVAVALLVIALGRIARWSRRRADTRHLGEVAAQRLIESLDEHLETFALDDPEVQAGLARLRAAVRDEHQEGGMG